MLRQISLEVTAENGFQDAAKAHGVKLTIVDCRPFNTKGMTMLLELVGPKDQVKSVMKEIGNIGGVRQCHEGEGRGGTYPVLVVLDRPSVCEASSDTAIICLQCPLNSTEERASWRFIARSTSDLRQILSKLGKEGVQARIEDASVLDRKAFLTSRQKEIMAVAMAEGYFEFPRKISLTGLSERVGVKPSTLSEILRSAERRMLQNAIRSASA